MKAILLAVPFLILAGAAEAGIPLVNATCPDNIEVHADEGGPIYINGKEADLKTHNNDYYEAKKGHVTISLSISPDGSPQISYTRKGGANGICSISEEKKHKGKGSCPPDVSEADRYKYPACG